jgi:imidazolonepropionase-like amidohydrolase
MSCASSRAQPLWGCDVIKTCASGGGGTDKEEPDIRNMTQEELDAIVDEAHAFHKPAAVHCFTISAQKWRSKPAPTPSSTWCFRTTSP